MSGYLLDRLQVNETLEIGITQDRWEQGESEFRRQVAEDGFFKFRTATFRDYIPIGTYKLTIRDIAGNPISPEAYPGPGIYQPTLEVTE